MGNETPTAASNRQAEVRTPSIRLQDLELALVSAKMRHNNLGRTCLLAAMTEQPAIEVDCHKRNVRLADIDRARQHGLRRSFCQPMTRGHIATLIERVRWQRGLPEIRKTWGTGIRALLAEPKYVLNGGRAA